MTIQPKVDTQSQMPERRADVRLPLTIAAKVFLPGDDNHLDVTVLDLSLSGAKLRCKRELTFGTELVLYIPGFDRFNAAVVWTDKNFCGVRFDTSPSRRERTAQQIVLYLTGVRVTETQQRRHARIPVPSPRHFTRPNGEVANFMILDISLSGASLKTMARPPIGEVVLIGDTPGRVSRHFDEGIAVEFVR
ncbi:MAG TPA: PilZ domain-containing protein [Rhizomicrobium sp.]|nr:PilZ domain-containing protein [Rhizomicrobium sp.]